MFITSVEIKSFATELDVLQFRRRIRAQCIFPIRKQRIMCDQALYRRVLRRNNLISAEGAICAGLIAMLFCLPDGNTAESRANGWSSVELLSNGVVSARLVFKQSASLADTNWLALELENHTPQPLKLDQIWIDLSGTRVDRSSGKVLSTGGGPSGTFPSIRTLQPGLHRFYGDALEYASVNIGLPPASGLRVEATVNAAVWVRNGVRYDVPRDKAVFVFEWRYPSAEEIAGMSRELKQHLAAHVDLRNNLLRMAALFLMAQVRDSLTLEDYLPALKATKDANVRWLLVPQLFARYSNAPAVLEYYREAFQKNPDEVYWDAAGNTVWNEEFLEPLVRGCEQDKWQYFDVLERHPAGWKNRPEFVARISAALLKHNPILKRTVRQLPKTELETWAKAVVEAGEVGDLALVELLKPALDDRRDARIDHGSGGVDEGRVCDRALLAILKLLDGDSSVAFTKAGMTYESEKQRLKVFDRMIGILKGRLKPVPK